jgi:GTPase SAR1 family protein
LYAVFVIGMAGSGKSALTSELLNWTRLKDQDVISLNLDPGVRSLPYNPDVDIRSYVSVEGLMEEYGLGPNGALLMAADLMGDYLEELRDEVESTGADLVLVDTPGQIELFAFRESGKFIAAEFTEDPKAVLYLLDGPFSKNPLNYISNMYMSMAVYERLMLPQIYVLSKADLLSEEELETVMGWSEDIENLEEALKGVSEGTAYLVSKELARAISGIGIDLHPLPVSSKRATGLTELYAEITRTLRGGEELDA